MYASQSEQPIERLPAGYERAEDAALAAIGIYHIREVYPEMDAESETVDRGAFSLTFDADALPLPVYVMSYGRRAMTEDELAARADEISAALDANFSAP